MKKTKETAQSANGVSNVILEGLNADAQEVCQSAKTRCEIITTLLQNGSGDSPPIVPGVITNEYYRRWDVSVPLPKTMLGFDAVAYRAVGVFLKYKTEFGFGTEEAANIASVYNRENDIVVRIAQGEHLPTTHIELEQAQNGITRMLHYIITTHMVYNDNITLDMLGEGGFKVRNVNEEMNPTVKSVRDKTEFTTHPPQVHADVPQNSQNGNITIAATNYKGAHKKAYGAERYQVAYIVGKNWDENNYHVFNSYSDMRNTNVKFPIRGEYVTLAARWSGKKGAYSIFGLPITIIVP